MHPNTFWDPTPNTFWDIYDIVYLKKNSKLLFLIWLLNTIILIGVLFILGGIFLASLTFSVYVFWPSILFLIKSSVFLLEVAPPDWYPAICTCSFIILLKKNPTFFLINKQNLSTASSMKKQKCYRTYGAKFHKVFSLSVINVVVCLVHLLQHLYSRSRC